MRARTRERNIGPEWSPAFPFCACRYGIVYIRSLLFGPANPQSSLARSALLLRAPEARALAVERPARSVLWRATFLSTSPIKSGSVAAAHNSSRRAFPITAIKRGLLPLQGLREMSTPIVRNPTFCQVDEHWSTPRRQAGVERRAEFGQISIDPGKPWATLTLRSAGPQSPLIAEAEAAPRDRNHCGQVVRVQIHPE